jgi:hypothetical protein
MLQDASSGGRLPAGMFLFGAKPIAASKSRVELQFDLSGLLDRIPS